MARAPYVVLGIGFLLMLMALLFNQGVVYIVGVPTGTYVVRGTPVGVFSLVLGWSLMMVAIGLSFGLAKRRQ